MKQENQVEQICSLVHEISINLVEWVGTGGKKSEPGSARIFRRQIGLDLF